MQVSRQAGLPIVDITALNDGSAIDLSSADARLSVISTPGNPIDQHPNQAEAAGRTIEP